MKVEGVEIYTPVWMKLSKEIEDVDQILASLYIPTLFFCQNVIPNTDFAEKDVTRSTEKFILIICTRLEDIRLFVTLERNVVSYFSLTIPNSSSCRK